LSLTFACRKEHGEALAVLLIRSNKYNNLMEINFNIIPKNRSELSIYAVLFKVS